MTTPFSPFSRRAFLLSAGTAAALPLLPALKAQAGDIKTFSLKASPAAVRLAPEPFPETNLWTFNGSSPGPEIRVRQGETVRIVVENALPDDTSVHWHGLRIPHAMDGVAHLTQPPIPPGGRFVYEFTPPDAGTFWYHPHVHSVVQTNMGLYGPFIVEEKDPIKVDRELTWVLGDWRLGTDGQMRDNFGSQRDYLRAGRFGNTVTLSGQVAGSQVFRAGERVRIRLLNACDARVFSLRFHEHHPKIIALDGQPVEPFSPPGGAVVLGPAQRADIIVDMEHKPGQSFPIIDGYYPQAPYELVTLQYSDEAPLRSSPLNTPIRLAANPVPKPDLSNPVLLEAVLDGGDMGSLEKAMVHGIQKTKVEMMAAGKMWAINGVASFHNHMDPMFTIPRGRTAVLTFRNRTVWPHPMHIHGHSFTVLEHDGNSIQKGCTVDTVLLGGGETAKVAFVADNPGDWMLHCHILGHADSGMMTIIRVA
ncbi:MAG: multicopper oxidase family protein [Magnetospirillum sp.]|nr:multicopper oxidase family protein [Magnetospirillum sp.]